MAEKLHVPEGSSRGFESLTTQGGAPGRLESTTSNTTGKDTTLDHVEQVAPPVPHVAEEERVRCNSDATIWDSDDVSDEDDDDDVDKFLNRRLGFSGQDQTLEWSTPSQYESEDTLTDSEDESFSPGGIVHSVNKLSGDRYGVVDHPVVTTKTGEVAATENSFITDQVLDFVEQLYRDCQARDLRVKNDWEAFRLAAVCASVDDAVRRIEKIRQFEDEHNLDDIDPVEAYRAYHEEFPDTIQTCSGYDLHNRLVLYSIMKEFSPNKFVDNPNHKLFLKYMTVMFNYTAVDVEELMNGMIWVSNAKDVGFGNFSMKFEQELAWMYQSGYPIKMKSVVFFNTGFVVRSIIKLCKVFLTKKMQDRILLVENDTKLLEIVPETSIPDVEAFGSISKVELEAMFTERVNNFHQQEKDFRLPKR
eukprot:CAMPEP_0203744522 /NCGR_PEP_ID=MMETSP0098-20131031/558_1 /ASSEMBLY_ACC=CAM_ASM_000208 /TAXON_ID=96639 /ORGANISM=" , Strain NY0313808BC1" /LENGTH=417 /DNA_ID=CAMNT_0050632059 /DNA_START=321 /DNA_END=1574 /DNA_ORIENTATION=-